MNYIEHRFSLVVDKTVSQASVKVKRGDTLNRLIINLTDHGYPYHISEECRAFFIERDVMNVCTIDNCSIIYDLTTQTVGTVGKHPAEIRLIGYNDEVITTAKFTIIVENTIYDDNQNETVPKNEVDALTGLISEASQLVADINESLENGDFRGEPGKSAYEIALEKGFEGTEEEWIESLNGAGESKDVVLYTPMSLENDKKAQARENIGAQIAPLKITVTDNVANHSSLEIAKHVAKGGDVYLCIDDILYNNDGGTEDLWFFKFVTTNVSGEIKVTEVQIHANKTVAFHITTLKTGATKLSELENDSGYITDVPVNSVNDKNGDVILNADDVGARPSSWMPTYTDVGAEKSGAAASAVNTHNTKTDAHNDIRLLITALTNRLDALANSDDTTLDQMAEVVAYIKANRNLIEQITTGKVSVSDIVDNLTTNVANKPLSAAQGVVLKALIDAVVSSKLDKVANGTIGNFVALDADGNVVDSGYGSSKFLTTELFTHLINPHLSNKDVHITAAERVAWNAKSNFSGKYEDLTGRPTIPTVPTNVSAFNNDAGYVKGSELEKAKEEIAETIGNAPLPDYWESYLLDKIATIKALQDEGGKDCFSFVVISDIHHPANLGKRSPAIAKRILDECDIKYALCLGDVQTRGCHNTKEQLLAENVKIETMLSPIRDRLLQTQGNHDGNYGTLNGAYYIYSLTKNEMHSTIYRKVGLVGECNFDESGTGYYIDDTANKVRYIVLNTHNTSYETNEDGTQKYSPMYTWRFTQSQFDLLIEALENIPSDSWSVVISAHVPLTKTELGDRAVMLGVLKAYKDKTTYTGEYEGTATGGALYTNQLPISTDGSGNIYNGTGFKNSTRLNSSGEEKAYTSVPVFVTGYMPLKSGQIVCLNGNYINTGDVNAGGINTFVYDENFTKIGGFAMNSSAYLSNVKTNEEGYITEFAINPSTSLRDCAYIRLSLFGVGEGCIITVNEEIIDNAHGYDYVSVDCDFTNSKGEFVGYFAGHSHTDSHTVMSDIPIITTRCDGRQENDDTINERVAGTVTEQSFDVFTVNKKTRTIHATKIGAGSDRTINY